MIERSIFANLSRDAGGTAAASYGRYVLHSALQPILRETAQGVLELEAIEGLVRIDCDGAPVAPVDFFALVDEADRAMVDSLCRSLHILNAGHMRRRDVTLLVNMQPGLFQSPHAMRQEVDRMRLAAHEAGLSPQRIACEIRERPEDDPQVLADFAMHLHEANFLVAIDEYAATDRDLDRLSRLKPDILKFDPVWVDRFAESSAGTALMRVVVAQIEREGVRPIVTNIEEPRQAELCREIGMPLMQGYLLARPQLVPTTLDLDFPDTQSPSQADAGPSLNATDTAEIRTARQPARFGRRMP